MNAEPPLSALTYAAQGILLPKLSFNHIPDLLDILSQVERVRDFSREHAKWALIWQQFYETRPDPNVRVLQKSDKDILNKVLKPERLDATRRIYVCIVEHIIRMVRILPIFLLRVRTCALLTRNSMCFIYGPTPRNRISYTTTSGSTFPGPMGIPVVNGFIIRHLYQKSKRVWLRLGCHAFASCIMRNCGRNSVFANSMFQCMFMSCLLRPTTEALYFQSPRFLLRQRPKFSSFEVQAHREYRCCGNRGFYHPLPEKSTRDGTKVATPSVPSRAMTA